jgi:hypothetical protein
VEPMQQSLQTAHSGFDIRDGQEIFLFSIASVHLWGPFSVLFVRYRKTEEKRPEYVAEYSPQRCTEVKNGGAITSLPYMSSWSVNLIY